MERLAFNYVGGPSGVPPRPEAKAAPVRAAATPADDRLSYLALLAFMFVLLTRPQDQLAFVAPLHLAEVFGSVGLVSLVLGRLSRGLPIIRLSPELVGVFVFALLIVGTVPFSFWPGGSMSLFTDVFIKVLLMTVLIVNTVTTRDRFEKVMAVVLLGTSYIAGRAIVDYSRGVNLVEDGRVMGAVGGLFGNPNDMALTMVSFMPFAIGLTVTGSRRSFRLLGLVALPALVGAVVCSKSRGGTVGLVVMLMVALYHLRRLRPGIAAAMLVAALAALPILPSSFFDRMSSIVNAEQDPTGSREGRKILLREGFQTFLSNPFIGIGAGQFPNYNASGRVEAWRQTHNAVLQVAAELGVVGLAVFFFMIASGFGAGSLALRTVRGARRRARAGAAGRRSPSDPEGAPADHETLDWLEIAGAMVIAAFTGWFVSSMFASVAYYWTLYILLATCSALRLITAETAGPARAAERSSVAAYGGARC
jgi:O-antigen ligase